MVDLRFRDPGALDDLRDLRDEVAALRDEIKGLAAEIARREGETREFERRVSSALADQMGPPRDGRLRNDDLAKKHDVVLRATHGIMPALDTDTLDDARRVVERTTGVEGVVAYKFGLTTVLTHGLAATVRALRQVTDLPLIYDHQKAGADVPDMAPKFARVCAEAGVDGVILFPVAGPRAVTEFVGHAYANRLLPVVGGDLPLPDYSVQDGGFIADDVLFRVISRCIDMGADHFIVPATQIDKLRTIAEMVGRRLEVPFLFLPGIGPLGGSISTAFAAAPGCRVYAVVGRAVYAADDPGEAARCLADEALKFA